MKRIRTSLIRGILISAVAVCLSACSAGTGKDKKVQNYAWPLGTSSPEDTVTQVFAEKFAEEVESLSNGTMQIHIYPNSTIGNDRELLESCKEGDIPFVVQNTAPQVSFMPEMAVFDIPVAFQSIEDARAAVDNPEFYEKIEDIYEKNGYRLLGMADQGFRVMTTNQKITDAGDFKGQKIRTMENANHLAFWQALGANPTPMAFSEVYIGLQQNTIDAEENPCEVIVSGKLYEQQDYVVETNHLPHYISMFVNDEFFGDLTEEQQQIITQAAETAKIYAREQADVRVADRMQVMEDSGTEVVELSEETYDEMKRLSQPLYDEIRSQVGEELAELYVSE